MKCIVHKRFNIVSSDDIHDASAPKMILVCCFSGTAETAIHFVIYEHLKKLMMAKRQTSRLDLTDCMWIAAVAKLTASSMCYPHGECQHMTRATASTHTAKTPPSSFVFQPPLCALAVSVFMWQSKPSHMFRVGLACASQTWVFDASVTCIRACP